MLNPCNPQNADSHCMSHTSTVREWGQEGTWDLAGKDYSYYDGDVLDTNVSMTAVYALQSCPLSEGPIINNRN